MKSSHNHRMKLARVDRILPRGKWRFDREVVAVFENMLARSIPQYEVMRRAVFDVASNYVQPNTCILDLGCSRGDAVAPLIERFGRENRFLGVDVSKAMLQVCRERFKREIHDGIVRIEALDLRTSYPNVRDVSLTLAVLTLMFIPIPRRQKLIRKIYDRTCRKGAFIMVEKVLGSSASINQTLDASYLKLKSRHGYTTEQIERKRLSLEGVLVPVTAKWIENVLASAGFKQIDCFWRWMNFAAWIAIKD